jgi:hypothetical protein
MSIRYLGDYIYMPNSVSINMFSSSLSVLTVLELYDGYLVAVGPVSVEGKF